MKDTHYDVLQDDISVVVKNVFGPQESGFLDDSDSSDSSEDSEGGNSDELEGPTPETEDLFITSQATL